MKHRLMNGFVSVLSILLLAACQPSTPMIIVVTATAVAATPTSVLASTELSPTSTMESLVSTGPELITGTTSSYVDSTLLVAVTGGPFIMGRPGGSDNPEHTVTIGDYWIYSTEVTNRQYGSCEKAGFCTPPDTDKNGGYTDLTLFDSPVTGVTWSQAQAYCSYVNGRLPTEAEWEKAARSLDASKYPWGNDTPSCELLNFDGCISATTNVTSYSQSQSYYGALNMAGNVFEWVGDWYDPLYYRTGPADDPTGPTRGALRVARSSSYTSGIDSVPSYVRTPIEPIASRSDLGFRCVVENPTYFAPFCDQVASYGPRVDGVQSSQVSIPSICPQLQLEVLQQNCNSTVRATNVKFSSDMPTLTTISGVDSCRLLLGTTGSFPQTYECIAETTVTIGGACNYVGLGDGYCPAHYELDPVSSTCRWDGSSLGTNKCLSGSDFDTSKQCCSMPSDTGITEFPLCAVGSKLARFSDGSYGCVGILDFKTVLPITKDVFIRVCP